MYYKLRKAFATCGNLPLLRARGPKIPLRIATVNCDLASGLGGNALRIFCAFHGNNTSGLFIQRQKVTLHPFPTVVVVEHTPHHYL